MLRTLLVILSLGFTGIAWSGDLVTDPETVKNIFNNKTAYGKHLKRDNPGYNVYFSPDGKLKKFNEDEEKDTGSWRINSEGMHCVQFDSKGNNEFCQTILAGLADGIYFRVKLKGNKKIKIVKLSNFRDGDQVPE